MHQPRAVVTLLRARRGRYRTELYPAYHAKREEEMPDELAPQFEAARDFFEAFGWTVATSDDLEADDLLGTYAGREAEAGGHALLLTGDRDMYQCAARGSDGPLRAHRRQRRRRGRPGRRCASATASTPSWSPTSSPCAATPPTACRAPRESARRPRPSCCAEHGSLEAMLDDAIREPRPKLRAALIEGREDLLAFKDIATLRDAGVAPPADRATDWAARRARLASAA